MKAKSESPFLRKYVTWITARPWWVIVAVLLVTVALGSQARHLRVDIDPDLNLPPDHPLVVLGNEVAERFGGKYVVVVGIEVKHGDIYNPATLAKVERITDRAKDLPGAIPNNTISLSALNVKDISGDAEGMVISRLMPAVPDDAAGLEALKERVRRNQMIDGLLVSPDRTMTMVIVDFDKDIRKAGGFNGIYANINKIIEPERDGNTVFHLAGPPIQVYELGVYSARMRYVFPLALAVIALLLFLAFRTVQGLVIPLVTAILSVIWAMGLLGLLGWAMDPYNLMTPILVLAVAAGHSVQILKRYYEEFHRLRDNRAAVVESTSRIGLAMLTAGFVAAAGFASLVSFKTPTIRAFGILSAFGILAALTIELTFIPAIRTLLKPPDEAHMKKEGKGTVFDPFLRGVAARINGGRSAVIFAVFAIIIVGAFFGLTKLKTDNSPSAFFSRKTPVIADLTAINDRGAGAFSFQVLVEGPAEDALKDPRALREMEKLQDYIATLPGVGKATSLVDFVKKMNRAMNGDDPAQEVLPGSGDLVAQYLLLYSMSGDPGDFDRVVDFGYQRAVITVYQKSDAYARLNAMKETIEHYISENLSNGPLIFRVGGGVSNTIALSEVVIHGKVQNILQVCAIILLVASLAFRSLLGGGLVLLPLLISILTNLGVMGLAGVRMSIPTATISAMILGIGADYAIYFLFRYREELAKGHGWESGLEMAELHSGKAILFVATAIALGYSCLNLTGFLIHIYLGLLVPLAMIISSLGALTLVPAIVKATKPKFLARKAPMTQA